MKQPHSFHRYISHEQLIWPQEFYTDKNMGRRSDKFQRANSMIKGVRTSSWENNGPWLGVDRTLNVETLISQSAINSINHWHFRRYEYKYTCIHQPQLLPARRQILPVFNLLVWQHYGTLGGSRECDSSSAQSEHPFGLNLQERMLFNSMLQLGHLRWVPTHVYWKQSSKW